MSDIKYEMPQDYQDSLNVVLDLIEERDAFKKQIPVLPPWVNVEEARSKLAELDDVIEKAENALAAEYNAYQAHKKAEAELNKVNKEALLRMQMMYIYFKYRIPDKLEDVKAAALNGFTDEEIQEFYDGVAILEATKLEEIIAEAE
jgi:nitrate reductase beta subunit